MGHYLPRGVQLALAICEVLKKHHWNDLLLTYQVLLERYGYMRSYGGFKRVVAQLKSAKPKRKKERKVVTMFLAAANVWSRGALR